MCLPISIHCATALFPRLFFPGAPAVTHVPVVLLRLPGAFAAVLRSCVVKEMVSLTLKKLIAKQVFAIFIGFLATLSRCVLHLPFVFLVGVTFFFFGDFFLVVKYI